MKTTSSLKPNQSGNVLLVALCVTAIAGLTLASFLTLTAGENRSVARSQNWNASIPIVEAGIEEAMTHLNDNCTYNDIQHPSTNFTGVDGWNPTDIGAHKDITLPDGSGYSVDIVTVAPYSSMNPAIVSQGHVAISYSTSLYLPNPFLAAIPNTVPTSTTSYSYVNTNAARKVLVVCGRNGLFAKGLVAKDSINLNGNNIMSDSFDSADPAFSSNGQYDASKHKDNGDVATDSGIVDTLNVGNANIYGHVSTGPGGSVSIGSNGKVGDSAWQAGSSSGVEPGHSSDDMNVYFPDVKPPFSGGYSTPLQDQTVVAVDRTTGTVTNTVTVWPAGQFPIITNTTTVTTATYPSAGTYLGTPTMNTVNTTTPSYPADGTYNGVIVTNTGNITTVSYPAPGTYIGNPVTNTTVTSTATYPTAGTYIGIVTTNTTSTNTPTYPVSGSYIGSVATNTVPTNNTVAPTVGTYVGSITTNVVTTNSATPPPGNLTGVQTNTTLVTTATYPAAGSYVPPVATNTTATISSTPPADGTYLGSVTTNTTSITSTAYPAAGTYVGSVTTNASPATSSAYPSSGTYIGNVATNTSSMTSSSFPSPGTYIGSVTTNVSPASSGSYPAVGTYSGVVTTNCGTVAKSDKNFPAAGTYCGTPWQTGNSTNNNSAWNWYPLDGYSYNKITGYNYTGITGYTYNKINNYTYSQIGTYSYNLITGYTYAQISTYSYIAGTNYSYLAISGYNYNIVSGFSFNQITGYSYQGISSYTYDLITGWTWAKIVSYTYYTYATTTGNTTNTYDWVLDDGNYELSSLSGSVLVRGNATLYVTDSINMAGHDQITINPGASLKLYMAGDTAKLGGNGVFNDGGNATNFMYYGLPSNQSVAISGNGTITGVIYAPEASLTLNGGGSTTTDFIGASVTGTATMNGHFNFHYDENLARVGPAANYAISSWNEIPLTQRY